MRKIQTIVVIVGLLFSLTASAENRAGRIKLSRYREI